MSTTVEIRIGVRNVARELTIETGLAADKTAALVSAAIAGGDLDLTDVNGRRILVPHDAIGYVEMGEESKRRVGFGA